jgi:type VI secretion system protein ImpC
VTKPWNLRFGAVNLSAGDVGDSTEMPPETPFRLLLVGNFSGQRASASPLGQRKPVLIDRDNFDEVLTKIAPNLTLTPQADEAVPTIAFRALDDFEPDRLFKSLAAFDELRTLQSQIGQPSTYEAAAAKVRAWASVPATPSSPPEDAPTRPQSGGELLAQMLDEPAPQVDPDVSEWQRFLKRVVQPQLVEKADPRKADYERAIEEAISARMRTILHDPRFQALEAVWRSAALLTQRLPTDETLQVHLFDVGTNELRNDLMQGDPQDSVFYRVVVAPAAEKPWAAVVCLDTFGSSVADLEALGSMMILAARARTPVLAGASPRLVGCKALTSDPDPREWKADAAVASAWKMIRGMAECQYLGVAIPRFVLRLPYGKNAAETSSFAFEEMPSSEHEYYLWGSAAVACALLLAEGFVASGWQMNPDDVRQVGGLPVHVYNDGGESVMKPCAEVYLRETALEALSDQGLMVFKSIRDRDGIQLARFQSASQASDPLAGRW